MEAVYIISVIGPFLIFLGMVIFVERKKFIKLSKVIDGVIIDIKVGSISHGETYFPIVRYYDEFSRKNKVYESNTGYSFSRFKIGDDLQLRYYSNGIKKKICLNTWFGIWGIPFVLFLVGTVCVFLLLGVE